MFSKLKIDFYPSQRLLTSLIFIYLSTFILVLLGAIAWPIKILFLLAILCGFSFSLHQHYFALSKKAIHAIQWDGERWLLVCNDGIFEAELLPGSVLSSWVLLLNFRLCEAGRPGRRRGIEVGRKRTKILFNDAADPALLRELRVFLRLVYPGLVAENAKDDY